jgi:LPS-assembly protein
MSLMPNARGAIFAEGYTDQRIDDGIGDNTVRWGYGDDPNLRTNEGRYWLRMKHDQEVGLGLNAKLDVDVVSDQDYLREFKSSYNGFDRTQAYFQGTFGRGIDDYNDAVRLNRLNLNRTWSQYSLNADLRWFDDVIKRTGDSGDDTLQQLPAITFGGLSRFLVKRLSISTWQPVMIISSASTATVGRESTSTPRIYYPIRYLGAVSVEPSLGFRQTAWHVDRYETEPDHGRDIHYRAIYDFRLDASAELFRVFNFTMAGSDLLKHTVTPR